MWMPLTRLIMWSSVWRFVLFFFSNSFYTSWRVHASCVNIYSVVILHKSKAVGAGNVSTMSHGNRICSCIISVYTVTLLWVNIFTMKLLCCCWLYSSFGRRKKSKHTKSTHIVHMNKTTVSWKSIFTLYWKKWKMNCAFPARLKRLRNNTRQKLFVSLLSSLYSQVGSYLFTFEGFALLRAIINPLIHDSQHSGVK